MVEGSNSPSTVTEPTVLEKSFAKSPARPNRSHIIGRDAVWQDSSLSLAIQRDSGLVVVDWFRIRIGTGRRNGFRGLVRVARHDNVTRIRKRRAHTAMSGVGPLPLAAIGAVVVVINATAHCATGLNDRHRRKHQGRRKSNRHVQSPFPFTITRDDRRAEDPHCHRHQSYRRC